MSEFNERFMQALIRHPRVPESEYGRMTWFQRELEEKTGVKVTLETVRKWKVGAAVPRQSKMKAIAETLQEDVSWISTGERAYRTPVESRDHARAASGSVLFVSGLLSMAGVASAFPEVEDGSGAVHLTAIHQGRQHAIQVSYAAKDEHGRMRFTVAETPKTTIRVGVVSSKRGLPRVVDLTDIAPKTTGAAFARITTTWDQDELFTVEDEAPVPVIRSNDDLLALFDRG